MQHNAFGFVKIADFRGFPVTERDQTADNLTQLECSKVDIFLTFAVGINFQRFHIGKFFGQINLGQQIINQALFVIADNVISDRYFLKSFHRRRIGIMVRMPAFGLLAVAAFYLFVAGVVRQTQNCIVAQRII